MPVKSLTNSGGVFPYLLALLLAAGSLVLYLAGAVVSRFTLTESGKTVRSFNLGIPRTKSPEQLFAISLVAAQTTLSTVFVLFWTTASQLGFHLLFCPFAFALGITIMFYVFKRAQDHGYLNDSLASGLIPYFGYRFTSSKLVSWILAIGCTLPILAILALELR